MIFSAWNKFFHSHLGSDGCLFAGWLRIGLAFLFVVDRLLLTLDIDEYFSPSHGRIPLWLGRDTYKISDNMYTIFQLAPESMELIWAVHWIGILQGVLLLLGIAPRLQIFGVYFNLVCFQHHNQVIWDGEDMMMKAFCTNMLFLPLHRRTIYDGFGLRAGSKDGKPNDSWPMWPIRLLQIHVCFIYMGASFGKIRGGGWTNGDALYYVGYAEDIYPGIYNPDFIFNRLAPLKFLTYSSLILETVSWNMVWVPSLRYPIVMSMILLHVGIDIGMNMHIFEWLAIVGWMGFLLQPDDSKPVERKSMKQFGIDLFIAFFLLSLFVCETPMDQILDLSPEFAIPTFQAIDQKKEAIGTFVHPILAVLGAHQYVYDMFNGDACSHWRRYYLRAEITLPDGTMKPWNSPRWGEQGTLERKRNMRPIDYWENVQEGSVQQYQHHLVHLMATETVNEHGGFQHIVLYQILEDAPPYNENAKWFTEPLRSQLTVQEFPLLTMYQCKDRRDDCSDLVQDGEDCSYEEVSECPHFCGACEDFMSAWHGWQEGYSGGYEADDEEDEYEEDEDDDGEEPLEKNDDEL